MKAANDEDEPMDLADLQNARLNYAAQGLGLEDLIDIFDADTAAIAEWFYLVWIVGPLLESKISNGVSVLYFENYCLFIR